MNKEKQSNPSQISTGFSAEISAGTGLSTGVSTGKKGEKKGGLSRSEKIALYAGLGVVGAGAIAWGIHELNEYDTMRLATTGGISSMNPGQSEEFPAGTIISGDITLNNHKEAYDNDPSTGNITELGKTTRVGSPWGARVQTKIGDEKLRQKTIADLAKETFRAHPEIHTVFVTKYDKNGNLERVSTINR